MKINGDSATVKAYEFIAFTWQDENGKAIDSGYGVPHEFKASLTNGKWKIINDSYDEGPLTDVKFNKADKKQESKNDPIYTSDSTLSAATISPLTVGGWTYNSNNAVLYADSYVYPNTNPVAHLNWDSYYNPTYRDYNGPGAGDCANFVSQCLLYGGAPYRNAYNDTSDAWWYRINPQGASTTWINAGSQFNLFKTYYGTQTTTISTLAKGDCIFYDWYNDGSVNHATIVVDPNGGRPLINAHNWDVYHVPYDAIKTSSDSVRLVKF